MILKQRGSKIEAGKILDAIEKGYDIDLDEYVIIEGDLDLSRLKNVPIGRIKERLIGGTVLGLCRNGDKIINSSIKIHNSKFLGKINFSCCIFMNDVNFWNCDFEKDSLFEGSEFQSDVWFDRIKFNGVTTFRGTYFCKDAEFFLSEFRQIADFSMACFEGFAYFYGVKIKEVAKFNTANFYKELSLDEALINIINLEAKFLSNSTVGLTNSYFSKFIVSWNIIKDRLVYNESAYLALVKNFEALGKFDDADSCYRQFRRKKREKLNGLPKAIDIISVGIYGYGIDPLYPLGLSALAIFVCSFFFFIYENGGLAGISSLCFTQALSSIANSLYFGLSSFFSTPQIDDIKLKWLAVLTRIAGSICVPIFLVTLAKKVLR